MPAPRAMSAGGLCVRVCALLAALAHATHVAAFAPSALLQATPRAPVAALRPTALPHAPLHGRAARTGRGPAWGWGAAPAPALGGGVARRAGDAAVVGGGEGVGGVEATPKLPPAENSTMTLLSVQRQLPFTNFLSEDDRRIVNLAVPAVINNMINPLVGAVDTFWVGRMGLALALAGQSASNQVFTTTFWLISFLPSVITPMIAKANAKGDTAEVQRLIGEAIFIATTTGLVGMAALVLLPDLMLGLVLPAGAPARAYAQPYLVTRGIAYIPAVVASVGFSAFRGVLDVVSPLKISAATQLLNLVLDPILIFTMGLGVAGAGLATAAAEVAAFGTYIYLMLRRNMVTWPTMLTRPKLASLIPLLKAGSSVQLRALVLQIGFVSVTRCVQSLDASGTSAAAHTVVQQMWQIGGIILFGFGNAAGIIIPRELVKGRQEGLRMTRKLLKWGLVMGIFLGALQLAWLPLVNVLSPLESVRSAARLPSIMAAFMQVYSGVVFVGEGVMMGYEAWNMLAFSSMVAAAGMLGMLKCFGNTLVGVWSSFLVFNSIRLCFVIYHYLKERNAARAEAAVIPPPQS